MKEMTDTKPWKAYEVNVKSQRGMTLIGVLIAVAVMGIVAATLASIYEGMTRVMQRASIQSETDNLQRFVQGVLAQKGLCDHAIRASYNGAPIQWDPVATNSISVQMLQLWNLQADAVATRLVSAEQSVNPLTGAQYNRITPALYVSSIKIQTRDTNSDGTPEAPSVTNVVKNNGETWRAIPLDVVIQFSGPGGSTPWLGGAFRARTIPIMGVFDTTSHLQECDVVVAENKQISCDLTRAVTDQGYGTSDNCPVVTCPGGPQKGIAVIAYMDGFDNNNQPKCNCQRVCGSGPSLGSGYNAPIITPAPTFGGGGGGAGPAGPAGGGN